MTLDSLAVNVADAARHVNLSKDRDERADLGQFLTPMPIASLMAGMLGPIRGKVRLLDPGAGSGALTLAFVTEITHRRVRPECIEAVCYEVDPEQIKQLRTTLAVCRAVAAKVGIGFTFEIIAEDFIADGVVAVQAKRGRRYDVVIMNPPYRKISTTSAERMALRSIGIETVNLYTGFMAVATKLMVKKGQFVAISPRSFCNGPYYRPFRQDFLGSMSLKRVHVFTTRNSAFGDDAVLQENVIILAVRAIQAEDDAVVVSESVTASDVRKRTTKRSAMVKPGDKACFIHIQTDAEAEATSVLFDGMAQRIGDLGLTVSTGPVVDFRLKADLSPLRGKGMVPLFWPCNCRAGTTLHPAQGKKPQWIRLSNDTDRWLSPNERYVLIKRFSAKEEKRRVVAVVHDPSSVKTDRIGLENHLNFIHKNGRGLSENLAAGIASYLNSGLLDAYFRQFNGHTQVNATDLRAIPFPTLAKLEALGKAARKNVTDPTLGDTLIRTIAAT